MLRSQLGGRAPAFNLGSATELLGDFGPSHFPSSGRSFLSCKMRRTLFCVRFGKCFEIQGVHVAIGANSFLGRYTGPFRGYCVRVSWTKMAALCALCKDLWGTFPEDVCRVLGQHFRLTHPLGNTFVCLTLILHPRGGCISMSAACI